MRYPNAMCHSIWPFVHRVPAVRRRNSAGEAISTRLWKSARTRSNSSWIDCRFMGRPFAVMRAVCRAVGPHAFPGGPVAGCGLVHQLWPRATCNGVVAFEADVQPSLGSFPAASGCLRRRYGQLAERISTINEQPGATGRRRGDAPQRLCTCCRVTTVERPDAHGEHEVVRLLAVLKNEILHRDLTDTHSAASDLVGRSGSSLSH